ncbi:hypothetical protein AAFG07_07550 [Bradyrhizobium sp. B097]|uniref:hypothetical protein n=1 Tax=Bradyrhizobium sp. B097 TaxID=3140244 RepID=UPI0031835841
MRLIKRARLNQPRNISANDSRLINGLINAVVEIAALPPSAFLSEEVPHFVRFRLDLAQKGEAGFGLPWPLGYLL